MLEPHQMNQEQQDAYFEGMATGSATLRKCRLPQKVDPLDHAPEYAKRPTLKASCWKLGFIRNFNFWAEQKGWPVEFLIPLVFDIPKGPDSEPGMSGE